MYYNRDHKKLEINLRQMEYLNEGACAKILYKDSLIFKKYHKNLERKYRIDPEIFDLLKNIHHKNFIELYDIYHYSLWRKFSFDFVVDAYTAKYYPNDEVNVFYENCDYLCDNIYEIEQLLKTFERYHILTFDLKRSNTILEKENIVLIDPDLFCFYKGNEERLKKYNRDHLLDLLYDILVVSAPQRLRGTNYSCKLDMDATDEKGVAYQLRKKLQGVKRPVDYF